MRPWLRSPYRVPNPMPSLLTPQLQQCPPVAYGVRFRALSADCLVQSLPPRHCICTPAFSSSEHVFPPEPLARTSLSKQWREALSFVRRCRCMECRGGELTSSHNRCRFLCTTLCGLPVLANYGTLAPRPWSLLPKLCKRSPPPPSLLLEFLSLPRSSLRLTSVLGDFHNLLPALLSSSSLSQSLQSSSRSTQSVPKSELASLLPSEFERRIPFPFDRPIALALSNGVRSALS